MCPAANALDWLSQGEVAGLMCLQRQALARFRGVGPAPDLARSFLVVLRHPVTAKPRQALESARATLEAVHGRALAALWFWLNVDAGVDGTSAAIWVSREYCPDNRIRFMRDVPPGECSRLLAVTRVVIANPVQEKAIAHAHVETDKVDAGIPARPRRCRLPAGDPETGRGDRAASPADGAALAGRAAPDPEQERGACDPARAPDRKVAARGYPQPAPEGVRVG